MPKPRTKRGSGREARKRKHAEDGDYTADIDSKRQRRTGGGDDTDKYNENENNGEYQQDEVAPANGGGFASHEDGPGEREFFGMLADEEQEYFRRADEMLELNQFPTPEDRALFLESVYTEARGKELKVASSQSCSRLMERLIQLATTAQKKRLFEAFAGHFLSLVQHRFASHCCEALFLRSAGVVSQELSGFVLDTTGEAGADAQEPENSMENLFLATLDELEGSMGFLMTDRFASHALRVLLLVLSGRPLEDAASRTLVKSRKKERVSVAGSAAVDEQNKGLRAVPASFATAVTKIIRDSTASMDAAGLRVLATHPIGNPTLQLFLELDLSLNKAEQKADAEQPTLLFQLLPGAPQSLFEEDSAATEFVNGMIYDPIGSRLVEAIITHAPGKVFKALNQNILLPRIQGYVRNDVSCYPAIKVLSRIGKDQLVEAVAKIAPTVPQLVAKHRYNVLRTLFERCAARGLTDEVRQLMKGLREGCGPQPADLVTTLCSLKTDEDEADEEKKKKKQDVTQLSKNEYAIQSHGAQLLTSLLAIPGPAKGVHESLAALPTDLLLRLANTSLPTATLLSTALKTPSANAVFQKSTAHALAPHVAELATSQNGHNVVVALAEVPSRGRDFSVPAHVKEGMMQALAGREAALRESWMGRSAWRAWRGDVWKMRRHDWKAWIKDMVAEESQQVASSAAYNKNGTRAGGKRKEN
ncbi:Armadillo-type fold protein [Cordyceps fumosorosea ARSEF 2679]|uniref:Nucleolar protein 9 n=1 Tax=Cordyceps fumosorosea (strain ARSEF 2679) TaxID=1081104 RepID=A0A162JSY8_CORFA|nr:Armadillo-type fold protein [Cordyceps fumosorosea ARSEF 2679]OAA73322.1 Armadillo-type fold protein [Cordyceps fumosorosea ARSEF 2679]